MEKFTSKNTSTEQLKVDEHIKLAKNGNSSRTVNFVFSLQPIFYLSRIFGFMPFSIVYNQSSQIHEPRIKKRNILWTFILVSLHLLSFGILWTHDKLQSEHVKLSFLIQGDTIHLQISIITGIIIIGIEMCNRFKFIGILNKFITFDKDVSFSANFVF